MARLAQLVLAVALGALALLGVGGPAANAAAAAPASVSQGTDDFTFDSWHSDFRLGRTAEGRSTLTTTETIVARFPDFDQNHGIRRAIPTHYRGHPTDLTIRSVTDENGTARGYETETSTDEYGDEFLDVTIAADHFVHGAQTYVITYSQANVILFPKDANDEEFYWEVNGTGWSQPFGKVTATLHVDKALTAQLTGQAACYQGASDSNQACTSLDSKADGSGWQVDAGTGNLGPGEGLTLVVGFQAGTFVPRDESFTANAFPSIGLAGSLVALVAAALAGIARANRWRNSPGRPTIIAEYLPPKGVNLLQAGDVLAASRKAMVAQLLSFAVRGNLRVLEGEGRKHYLLELVHAEGLGPAEHGVLAKLFPGLQPGTIRDLKAKDPSLSTALQSELRATRKSVITDGLREKRDARLRGRLIALGFIGGIVGVAGSVIALSSEIGGDWPGLVLLLGVLGVFLTLVFAASVRPLTAAGAELRDYLKGVKLYIRLAEADRLRVLQSPEGALRSPYRPEPAAAGPVGPVQVLKLYERLLPFAVLFGQEKEWSRVLGEYYEASGSRPDWYSGAGAFNAGYFAAGISSFSSATAASWSGTASSSSSSGMGGGGSVGGGGGGGGGGGV